MALAPSKVQRNLSAVETVPKTLTPRTHDKPAVVVLALLLAAFVLLQSLLPIRTVIQIGADEGFELAKATLCLKGFKLYTDVWNDQPPLHTFFVTQTLKHLSPSILGPRLVTCVFTMILLASIFFISLRVSGLLVAALTTGLLIASPGFVELSSSCMLEIPALAPAVAALCLLLVSHGSKWYIAEILSGALFGLAFQIKLINVILLPLAAVIIWLQHRASAPPARSIATSLLVLVASLAISFVATDYLVDGGAYLSHFRQSWSSHFAVTKSFEYGSPDDHPYDWTVLLKNWDTTIPAIVGIILLLWQVRRWPTTILPLAWPALTLIVFTAHKPWWQYYYIHNAIPLCWCAAIGIEAVVLRLRLRPTIGSWLLAGVFAICALGWMGARVYLQVASIRHSPRTYSSLVLKQIERLKPFVKFMYSDEPIYSFHAGIPMPPSLAVVPLKRLWSGALTNARIAVEMSEFKPEVSLLTSDLPDRPFSDLINAEYRPVYEDGKHQLYVKKSIAKQAGY
ncbi:MAG: hypothetical protein AUI36_47335 [Cyanobacteria bacterium 13_1_40CM_2_61_4]|nr:MAG: hypothetical protein AUI36_47335 [Cyanobacteria bacterium 13_1_40CM_2_61_4]